MDNFREITTFLIGLAALIGCGLLIFTSRGSEEQAWLMIGIILAYYFNRQQQSSAVRDVISSQPSQTITTSAGPPQTTTVTDTAKVDPAEPFPDDRYEFR